ncbi:FAD-dependent oxidoreductase [Loktanella sp. Alg231-35]|uniref:FAD-dependent oxidoreductase n=1 Tax=Loktanella sp. Alg231-35 TaxID=1922220 RepID=UPI000D55C256|nr:FAD-dependent oxidoreductase [Loktanella sp. Alg231-35]
MTSRSSSQDNEVDFLIIGGGFYGCCLALYLRSLTGRIAVIEAGDQIMTRASRVNQARVHTGFHYPRSMLTAAKSMVLHRRFAEEFPDALISDFRMLYGIARYGSRVPVARFWRNFHDMGAPIAKASVCQQALFNSELVEAAFDCTEFAFDYSVLRQGLMAQIDRHKMDLRLNTEVVNLTEEKTGVRVTLTDGREITASTVFNVTYSHVNRLLRKASLPPADIKHELTEVVLADIPTELDGRAITLMDGPFFSVMPYPAEQLYSLTHVRYTPHLNWADTAGTKSPYQIAQSYKGESRAHQMKVDAQRYVPCLANLGIRKSIFDVKTVLQKNEQDDGRPILFQRKPDSSRIISILGGKIDNIYDLFDLIKTAEPEWTDANLSYLLPGTA